VHRVAFINFLNKPTKTQKKIGKEKEKEKEREKENRIEEEMGIQVCSNQQTKLEMVFCRQSAKKSERTRSGPRAYIEATVSPRVPLQLSQ
jgi:hypothetical protein